MEECIVTRNATLIVRKTLARAERMLQRVGIDNASDSTKDTHELQQMPLMSLQPDLGMNSTQAGDMGHGLEGAAAEVEFDWMNAPFAMDDGQQALFWVEWAHHLEDLGA